MVYRNEKEGVFKEVDKKGTLKPIIQKNCKQCGELFKTQTRVNYCHEGCTSKRIKNRIIDKNQIIIKELKPLTMKDIFKTDAAPKRKQKSIFKSAEEMERRVFDLLIKSFPNAAIEANFTSKPQASNNIYKGKTNVPKPDITIYKEDGTVVLIDVKHVEKFYLKNVYAPTENGTRTTIKTLSTWLDFSDYNNYKIAKELIHADCVWIAFVNENKVYFVDMVKDGEIWEEKQKYNYYQDDCRPGKKERKGFKVFDLGQ
tara:strand:- start:47 stop:817 length:771 start_codon:yes stop_codon:yes gene_type:complete